MIKEKQIAHLIHQFIKSRPLESDHSPKRLDLIINKLKFYDSIVMITYFVADPLVHKLQAIHPKQNQKPIMHGSNKLCKLQNGRKNH